MGIIAEIDRAVFQFQENSSSEADLLLLVKDCAAGEDACAATGSWKCLGLSWEYALWPAIGERAGLCEVGRLIVRNISCTMEEYISLFRMAIKKAQRGAEFFARFSVSAVIDISEGYAQGDIYKGGDYERECLESFLSAYEPVFQGQIKDGLTVRTEIALNDHESLCAALSLSHYFPDKYKETAQTVIVKLLFSERTDKPAAAESEFNQVACAER